jgi:tRNA pseudouridine55 synthase
MTSHDVVARVRRAARTRRVGHAGTLDPFATGVLVVCLNRATRLVQFLVSLNKEYVATVRLGFATDTQDHTGKQITPLEPSNHLKAEEIIDALASFKGRQLQLPPMYSAKKVGGQKLYEAARLGREVERKAAPITVYSIELLGAEGEPLKENEDGTREFVIRVECSSGTYVRTLAHDIGRHLGAGAHLSALRRTKVGHLELSSALTLDEVESKGREGSLMDFIIRPAEMLAHLSAVRVDEGRLKLIANGREVALDSCEIDSIAEAGGPLRLCDEQGRLIAVADYDAGRKTAKPRVVLDISS